MATFSAWDYVVVVAMMAVSAGIGIYYRFTGGKQKTTSVSIDCEFPREIISFQPEFQSVHSRST